MPEARPARLLGDIGGTNARFAWQDADGAPLRDIATIPTADHPTLAAALAHYLHGLERAAPPWCAIGIANPITGDRVQMTNSHWSFSIEAVRRELGFERFVVINDFTALALAIPDLPKDELRQLGGDAAVARHAARADRAGHGAGCLGPRAEHRAGPLGRAAGRRRTCDAQLRATRARPRCCRCCAIVSATRRPNALSRAKASKRCTRRCARSMASRTPPPCPPPRSASARWPPPMRNASKHSTCSAAFLGNVAGNLALTLGRSRRRLHRRRHRAASRRCVHELALSRVLRGQRAISRLPRSDPGLRDPRRGLARAAGRVASPLTSYSARTQSTKYR